LQEYKNLDSLNKNLSQGVGQMEEEFSHCNEVILSEMGEVKQSQAARLQNLAKLLHEKH